MQSLLEPKPKNPLISMKKGDLTQKIIRKNEILFVVEEYNRILAA
jgi:hypothetical protein